MWCSLDEFLFSDIFLSFGRKLIDWISNERHRIVDFYICRVDSFPFEWFLLGLVNLSYRKMIQTNAFQVYIVLTILEYNLVTLQFVHSWAKIYRFLQNDFIYFSLTYCLQNYKVTNMSALFNLILLNIDSSTQYKKKKSFASGSLIFPFSYK